MAFDRGKPYVLLTRRNGGYGDLICCSVAVRACRRRYRGYQTVWALNSIAQSLFSDQDVADEVISPYPWDESLRPWIDRAGLVISLDGPEQVYAKRVNWNLKKSRTEVWCEAADVAPKDMCPHWRSRKEERIRIAAWGKAEGRQPCDYVVLQWRSADPCKDYVHNLDLLRLLREAGLHVVVGATFYLPGLGVKCALDWPIRYYAALLEQAALAIGPDTVVTHLSAATDTPYLGLFATTNPEVYCKHYPLAECLCYRNLRGKQCSRTLPCYNLTSRGWWCQQRSNRAPWCLEQIKPQEVVDKALAMLARYKRHNLGKARRLLGALDLDLAGPPKEWYQKDELLAAAPPAVLGSTGPFGLRY